MTELNKPLWLWGTETRKLKLRFSGNQTEQTVRFTSDLFLALLDEQKLGRGVTCASKDTEKQRYTFRFAKTAARGVSFTVGARKAGNNAGVLSLAIEGRATGPQCSWRITTYDVDKLTDPRLALLVRDWLLEIPKWARAVVVTGAALLLAIWSPWYGMDRQTALVRFHLRPDLTREEFDGIEDASTKWELSGACTMVDPGPLPFVRLTAPCWALSNMKSNLKGWNPLSEKPSIQDFDQGTFGIKFGSADSATILLHAARALFGLTRGGVDGDRLLLQRVHDGSSRKLRIALNCGAQEPQPCTEQRYFCSREKDKEEVKAVTVSVTSGEGRYSVNVTPDYDSGSFDYSEGVGCKPGPETTVFTATSKRGRIGFLATDKAEYLVVIADVKPSLRTRPDRQNE